VVKRRSVKRTYDTTARRAVAAETRAAILRAAHAVFVRRGFASAKMAEIAEEAGVAVDTIYATVGTKYVLFRTLLESAISGADDAVPAESRAYVRAIREEPDAKRKLAIYAAAIREIHQRLAPLVRVLKEAASADADLAALWKNIADRRAANMRLFARDLAATGSLRRGLGIDEVADIVWATNAPEFYLLLVEERGWTPERFERWLADSWCRLLLRDDPHARRSS
jgi:AcrR family transcriptional regulator